VPGSGAGNPPARDLGHDSDRGTAREKAIELRERLWRALELVPVASDVIRDHMGTWLEILPLPADGRSDPVEFWVLADVDLTRITWFASGKQRIFRDLIREIFISLDVSNDELRQFLAAEQAITPRHMGTWLELSEHGFDGGWAFRPPLTLSQVLAMAPPGEASTAFAAWAQNSGSRCRSRGPRPHSGR
jgi:hypothetical protein